MKKLRKILVLVLTLSLFLNFPPLNLANAEEISDQTIIINEYQALKELNREFEELKTGNKTKSSFNVENYSKESLDIIENYEEFYKNKIENLKNADLDTLIFLGYDEEQIEAIQNFDGSEEMIIKAASRLTLTTGIRNHEYNARYDKTTARLNIDFRWAGSASFEFNDLLAIVWADDYVIDTKRSYLEVEYINEYYREYETESYDILFSPLTTLDNRTRL